MNIERVSEVSDVAQSCLTLCNRIAIACQAPLSMEFSRQEYWSGLPFPSPKENRVNMNTERSST